MIKIDFLKGGISMAQVIKKDNNRFRIVCSLGYGADGRQIRKTTTFKAPEGTTPKKAERLANEFAIDFERKVRGNVEFADNMKFSELCEQYFNLYAKNELKGVTAYTYQGQVKNHLLPEFENLRLKNFTPNRISNYFAKLKLQPQTCKKIFTILESIFSFAVRQGFILKNPCVGVILPKSKSNEDKKMLNSSQVKTLMKMLTSEDVESSQFSAIIRTLILTGMRASESLALQWGDVDFENSVISIRHNLCYDGQKTWLDEPKTKKSRRVIAMSAELAELLKNHYTRQQIIKNSVKYDFNPIDMVFTSQTGGFKDRSGLLREFKRFIKDTDFSFATLHMLRHANATLLLNSGIDIKLVSENLGHSNISTTADIYADVLLESKRKMADLVSLTLSNK